MSDVHEGDVREDRELVELAQRDADMDAFEVLYRRYVGRIHAFAFRRSGSVAVADDITSSTFERALRNVASFQWRGGGFESWLFRIAASELANHYRAVRRTGPPQSHRAGRALYEAHEQGVEEQVLATLDAGRVREALTRLKPRHQEAISLRYLAGLSAAQAAAAMGIAKELLAVTLHRALAALGRELEHDDPGAR